VEEVSHWTASDLQFYRERLAATARRRNQAGSGGAAWGEGSAAEPWLDPVLGRGSRVSAEL